jgi:TPR repeat protein
MATTLNDQTQDLLARFLPPNTDARVISHYLDLLAESEQRLRREVMDLRAASKSVPPKTATTSDLAKETIHRSARKYAPIKAVERQKQKDQTTAPKKYSSSVAEVNYQAGLKHLNAGGKTNLTRAVDCFLTADAYGHAEASVALAELFYYGKHVGQDLEKSMLYYQNAAATGHAHALYSVAYMTYHGEGELMDKDEAVKLFRMAASKGSTDAKEMLDWLRCRCQI